MKMGFKDEDDEDERDEREWMEDDMKKAYVSLSISNETYLSMRFHELVWFVFHKFHKSLRIGLT